MKIKSLDALPKGVWNKKTGTWECNLTYYSFFRKSSKKVAEEQIPHWTELAEALRGLAFRVDGKLKCLDQISVELTHPDD